MRNCIGIITIYGCLKNIYGIYMSHLWHLDELSMALRCAIYGFFLHTDYSNNIFAHGSHITHGFYSFHSWGKKYLV